MCIRDRYKKLLKNKAGHEVIVAVLDGGVDINHEDLKQNIWVNPKAVSYTHLRAHETVLDLVCRLLLEKKT